MIRKRIIGFLSAGSLILGSIAQGEEEPAYEMHGAGWVQMGMVAESSLPKATNDYKDNLIGNSGGLLNLSTTISENWRGQFGMGTILVHLARGGEDIAGIWYPFWVSFVSEAHLTYTQAGYADGHGMKFQYGAFGAGYNADSKAFGNYLYSGYAYPGIIKQGANSIFGTRVSYQQGWFQNDLVINAETEDKPLYDLSVANILTVKPHASIEWSAGFNLYRVLPNSDKVTNPDKNCVDSDMPPYAVGGNQSPCYLIRTDTATQITDTLIFGLSGTKLMSRLRFDPKVFFGSEAFGPNEWVLYAEVGVLGVKDYPVLYDKLLRRMPVMVGFNVPTWSLFELNAEVEYYASKNVNDIIGPQNGSPLPSRDFDMNQKRDDWKWAVNASRMVGTNVQVSTTFANDHLRLGGSHNSATGIETTRTPKDWYWTFKTAFFF